MINGESSKKVTMIGDHGVLGYTSFATKIRDVTGQLPIFSATFPYPEGTQRPTLHNEAYAEGRWFYVEIHVGNFGIYGPAALGVVHDRDMIVEMLSAYVLEPLQRRGFGRLLIEVAGGRWPDLSWNDTMKAGHFTNDFAARVLLNLTVKDFISLSPNRDARENVYRDRKSAARPIGSNGQD